MKADQAKALADTALKDLACELDQGRSDALTRYLAMLATFHNYSFGNVMLILAQRPDASRVAGFATWKTLGRFVRRGEKGIVIIAPMRIRTSDERDSTDREGDTQVITRFRAVRVFDLAQTEGDSLPEPSAVSGDPSHSLAMLRSAVVGKGISLDDQDLPLGADGVSRGGRISLRADMEPAHTFSVLAHEFAHELLHHAGERPDSKSVRETEAEAVAYVVCRSVGLETNHAASDYIQLYQGDAKTLASSLDRIQKAATEIITAINNNID